MTFFGCNKKIGNALMLFGESIVELAILKTETTGLTIADHISTMLTQLQELIDCMSRETLYCGIDKENDLEAIRSLTIVCQLVFSATYLRCKSPEDFKGVYMGKFEKYRQLIKVLEDAYEGCPDGTDSSQRTEVAVKAVIAAI